MIVIVGVPGVGKSTLGRILAEDLKWTLMPEPVEENPYLEGYYRKPEEYAFKMQTYLLHERYIQALEAQNSKNPCVLDASMHVNDIFSSLQYRTGIMPEADYNVYKALSSTLHSQVRPPDLIVYLRCPVSVAVKRILKRGRKAELRAPLQYWCDINIEYEEWFLSYSDGPKLAIDASDNLDILCNKEHRKAVITTINNHLKFYI